VGRLPRMRCDRRAADDSVVEKTPQGLKTPAILLTPFDTEPVERSARTPACRVHTHVNAWDSVAVGPASSTEPALVRRCIQVHTT
jgi:hypothetical protein